MERRSKVKGICPEMQSSHSSLGAVLTSLPRTRRKAGKAAQGDTAGLGKARREPLPPEADHQPCNSPGLHTHKGPSLARAQASPVQLLASVLQVPPALLLSLGTPSDPASDGASDPSPSPQGS
jgi:hypothetical protein